MIKGERIQLRPISYDDIDIWLEWLNDPEVTKYLAHFLIYGMIRENEEDWYNNMRKSKNDVLYAIEKLEDGKNIGSVGLHGFNPIWRCAEIGIMIGDKNEWGKGYCTDAMSLMCEFGFNRMNLHRIELHVHEENLGGFKCYEKVGFVKEGVLRKRHYYDGKYSDIIIMGLLKGELK